MAKIFALTVLVFVASAAANSGDSTGVRTIRSISNIAKLLFGGNVGPDHPLVKYSDSNSAASVSQSQNTANRGAPNLNQNQQSFQSNQNYQQAPPQFNQNYQQPPPQFNQNYQQAPPPFNQNYQQGPPQFQRQNSQFQQQNYQNFNGPNNGNNFGQQGQYSTPIGQNSGSSYVPSSVIYSPPLDAPRQQNQGQNWAQAPPLGLSEYQAQNSFQNQNNYQQQNNGFQNPPPPQFYQNQGQNYQQNGGPYQPPQRPFNPPQSFQQNGNQNYNNNFNNGPPQFNQNQNYAPPSGNALTPTPPPKNNEQSKPTAYKKPLGTIAAFTNTLNSITSYIPKITLDISATKRDSFGGAGGGEEHDNSKIRRDDLNIEEESHVIETQSGAAQVVDPSTYFLRDDINENVEYNYMNQFKALDNPTERAGPLELVGESVVHNLGLSRESLHVIPSVPVYQSSYSYVS